ncbi:L-fuculose kinase fucK [Streptococcus pneumoniae]|nr:L-fuculose kinase fucK [Streptococcus pneumoniae]
MEAVLAIDLGATSGRAIVGYLSENKLVMEEINRFSNLPIRVKGHLSWDIDFLLAKILESIRLANTSYKILSIGIDTWGVDLDWLIMKVSCYYNLFIIVMKEQREC